MTENPESSLPAEMNDESLVVSYHDEGLLVGGDPAAVESYLTQLRRVAGRGVRATGIDAATVTNATGLIAGVATAFGNATQYVQLHPESITALRSGNWIPGTDGFFRMTTRDPSGTFLAQLQWKPAHFNPTVMTSAQMVAVQVALVQAIAKVEEAVRRVEGKVESVLELAKAARAGDVLGNNLTITRMVDSLDRYDSLPDAYWDSIASLGPALVVTVEQLRNHVCRILNSLDRNLPVQQRAEKLRSAIEGELLGESLSLLVIAEESLYKWQRLNIARFREKEPHHLLRAIDEARDLLRSQLKEDAALYRSAKEVLDSFARPDAIEGFRYWSVRRLARSRSVLQEELDLFAEARRHQVESWEDLHIPSFVEAASAAVNVAVIGTGKALAAAGGGLVKFGNYLSEPPQRATKSERKLDADRPADGPSE